MGSRQWKGAGACLHTRAMALGYIQTSRRTRPKRGQPRLSASRTPASTLVDADELTQLRRRVAILEARLGELAADLAAATSVQESDEDRMDGPEQSEDEDAVALVHPTALAATRDLAPPPPMVGPPPPPPLPPATVAWELPSLPAVAVRASTPARSIARTISARREETAAAMAAASAVPPPAASTLGANGTTLAPTEVFRSDTFLAQLKARLAELHPLGDGDD